MFHQHTTWLHLTYIHGLVTAAVALQFRKMAENPAAPRRRGIEEVKEILRSFRKRFGVGKKTSDTARTSLFQLPQGECLLYNLPPEILLLFCSFLDDASLVCFSYTSKVLRAILEGFGIFNLDPASFSRCLRWVITSRFEQGVRIPSLFLHSSAASP